MKFLGYTIVARRAIVANTRPVLEIATKKVGGGFVHPNARNVTEVTFNFVEDENEALTVRLDGDGFDFQTYQKVSLVYAVKGRNRHLLGIRNIDDRKSWQITILKRFMPSLAYPYYVAALSLSVIPFPFLIGEPTHPMLAAPGLGIAFMTWLGFMGRRFDRAIEKTHARNIEPDLYDAAVDRVIKTQAP